MSTIELRPRRKTQKDTSVALSADLGARMREFAKAAGVTSQSLAEVAIHEYMQRNKKLLVRNVPDAEPVAELVEAEPVVEATPS